MTPTLRYRPRRLRRHEALRAAVRETHVAAEQLIMPHFVLPQADAEEPVPSMPGIARMGVERLLPVVESDLGIGIRAVLLFGLAPTSAKDPIGSAAADPGGSQAQAIRALKERFGDDLVVISDVCLCGYTDHGHCGIVEGGRILNDPSLERLAAASLCHAQAGVDLVAPSDMMDGRVRAIREALDANGFSDTGILSYAAKYASAYYGPFRDAAESAPQFGDRRSYQMDPANAREAVREALLDEREGADILMVKPGLPYLDVLQRLRGRTELPLAAYNVSGEFSAVKAAAAAGWLDEAAVVRENLLALRRAGADLIITYHAREALAGGWL